MDGCFLFIVREGDVEDDEDEECGDLGGEGVFNSNGLSRSLSLLAMPGAIVTIGGSSVTAGC